MEEWGTIITTITTILPLGRAFHGKEGAEADDSAGDSEHPLHLL